MIKKITLSILLCSTLLVPCLQTWAQKPAPAAAEETRILFLFDASASMMAQWQSGNKYIVATKLLSQMIDSLQNVPNLQTALRMYGHTKKFPPQDCDDTRLEVPFGYRNGYLIKRKLGEYKPSGTTPIAMSLEACGGDFPKAAGRNIIILITDGIEECNGDPCAVSYALQRKGISLKPFVIGLGVNKEFAKQFDCIGTYYDAKDEATFKNVFDVVISQALNNTSAQINLLDIYGKPTETNVAMTFYDMLSDRVKYNYIHTMNAKGLPDTIKLDPLTTYRMTVHTVPPVSKDSIKLTPGKHTVIGVDCPQGDLKVVLEESYEYKNLKCVVRKNGQMQTLNVQNVNSIEKYIVGYYDLEILTLPRIIKNKIEVKQSHTTTVEIPRPGIVNVISSNPGVGSVLLDRNGELEWVCDIDDNTSKQTITLQPGNYRLVFRPKASRETMYSIEKVFNITPGGSTNLQVN